MHTSTEQLADLPEIRRFVAQTLCERDRLEQDAFPIREHILRQKSRPCGILFCLKGPRRVRLTAIWETESNTILFYDSRGEHFQRTQLISPPELAA